MIFDGNCTISKEKSERYKVAQTGSIVVFPTRCENAFAMNTSNLDQYIPNATFVSHMDKSSFDSRISMAGSSVMAIST